MAVLKNAWYRFMVMGEEQFGYTLPEILGFDAYEWHTNLHFIKLVFPIASPEQAWGPSLSNVDFENVKQSDELRRSIRTSIHKFLYQFGIKYEEKEFRKAHNFKSNSKYWLCSKSPSHESIERLTVFCCLLGREKFSKELVNFVSHQLYVIKSPPLDYIERLRMASSSPKPVV